MPLNIKDPQTDRLARELSALTGESLTEATRRALEERLQRVRRHPDESDDLTAIITRGRARRILDDRSVDEILGYGPDGMPA